MELKIDQHSSTPLYRQIEEQIRGLIASDKLKQGDRLPAVRELARSLKVNQNTVVRAYLELEQEQVIVCRRGGGTIISAKPTDPTILALRQKRLHDILDSDIVRVLSMGYAPEEVEAAFHLHISRWREERLDVTRAHSVGEEHSIRAGNMISVVGSHDPALDLLLSLCRERSPLVDIQVTHAGSLGGLIALQEERAHLAGIHLLDEETGEYNYPYIRRILPGREVAVVHLAYRIQGLIFEPGNPKGIKGLDDLRRQDISFVNRQKGSGTRVLLDLRLRQRGIVPGMIQGYGNELDTHLSVALAIAHGEADAGLGVEAAARSFGLDFLPLFRERYDLVMPKENYQNELLRPLIEIAASGEFRNVVTQVGGYDTTQTGSVTLFR
ncbi:MAG: GntR family transcriptional regulator [Dehalococcoidia bacterium]|nr:GntR family transcriptional regulator [Dehalococcoidia bacterium]